MRCELKNFASKRCCKEKAYAEVYWKDAGWCYLCKKHFLMAKSGETPFFDKNRKKKVFWAYFLI
jgi:hypothetical protein